MIKLTDAQIYNTFLMQDHSASMSNLVIKFARELIEADRDLYSRNYMTSLNKLSAELHQERVLHKESLDAYELTVSNLKDAAKKSTETYINNTMVSSGYITCTETPKNTTTFSNCTIIINEK